MPRSAKERQARRPSYTNSRDRSLMSYILKEPTINQARENSAAMQGISSSDMTAPNSVEGEEAASTPELEYFHMRDVSANRRHSYDEKKTKKGHNGRPLDGPIGEDEEADGEGEGPPSPPGPRAATSFPAPKTKKMGKTLPKKMNTVGRLGWGWPRAGGAAGPAGDRRDTCSHTFSNALTRAPHAFVL